jgi:pSer/pThr/pTyr-binding forkhead associated (FHA) protein
VTAGAGAAWSFRGGDWFGIFGPRATVVLPPSQKARVAALWELVDDGAGFDETLDALISTGLRELPGFVLVSTEAAEDAEDAETKVVIRGAARVHLATGDEVVHVEGDDATTWVERSVTGVTRVRIEVADDAGSGDLDGVLDGGLVRLACAEHPPPVEEVPEVRQLREQPQEAAVRDHDGLTRGPRTEPMDLLGPPPPGIPGQPPAPPVTTRPVARLLLPDGETVDVDRSVLLGRAPDASRIVTEGEPRLVTVSSPHHEVSSTHLEVRPGSGADHGSAVATDLGSTNGSVVVQPGLPPEDLRPGVTVQLVPGAVVDLGDGVTIEVIDA